MLYRTLKPNVLTQEELQEIFDSIDFELAEKGTKKSFKNMEMITLKKALLKKDD